MTFRKSIILHDYFNLIGGAERVVAELAVFFNWPVVTGNISPLCLPIMDDIAITSLESEKNRPFYLGFSKILTYGYAFSNYSGRTDFDLAVFSGDFAPFSASKFKGRTILYCHTPPRVLYDRRGIILEAIKNPFKRKAFEILLGHFKKQYEKSLDHIDLIIANSANIQSRIKTYLKRDAVVIYPPVDTEGFSFKEPEDYYLSTARLSQGKRVPLIVEAFLKMPDKNLVIISDGENRDKITKRIQGAANIRYLGWVPDAEKAELMSKCTATIYIPMDEDFGISPVESMAAGKPVIGVMEGGLLETVVHQKTGILIDTPVTAQKIMEAVQNMDRSLSVSMKDACIQRAARFSRKRFFDTFSSFIDDLP